VPNPAPNFVYVIYIAASVYKVWEGLINRGLTQVYWAHYNVSDWKAGSRWQHVRSDKTGKVDIVGRVVEVDPPRRLVITWAFPGDAEDQKQHSRVTFELQALGPDTRLTVTHSDLERDSDMLRGITEGWPAVLSNLKTLLETGRTLSDKVWS
jgi:uncharacterized protein YndB with AHSA1/START domain